MIAGATVFSTPYLAYRASELYPEYSSHISGTYLSLLAGVLFIFFANSGSKYQMVSVPAILFVGAWLCFSVFGRSSQTRTPPLDTSRGTNRDAGSDLWKGA
jgi:hypothetical protein